MDKTSKKAIRLYLKGLRMQLAEILYGRENPPTTLDQWMSSAATLDTGMKSLHKMLKGEKVSIPNTHRNVTSGRGSERLDEPMDIGAVEQKSTNEQRCFTCDGKFHLSRDCPFRGRNPQSTGRGGRGGGRGRGRNNFQPHNNQGQFQQPNNYGNNRFNNNRSNVRAMEEPNQTNVRAMNVDFDKAVHEAVICMLEKQGSTEDQDFQA